MRPVRRTRPPLGTRRAGTERDRYPDNSYGAAAAALAERLGEYCSYCEAPVQGAIQIEHMMAKLAGNNTEAEQWCNFLLACNQCNSKKGNMPDSAERLSNYLWPSIVARIPGANQPAWCLSSDLLLYELRAPTAAEQAKQALDDGEPHGPYAASSYVFVRPADGLDDVTVRRAWNIIDLVGLNTYRPATRPGDRRFEERTKAWSIAGSLARDYVALPPTTPIGDLASLETEITGLSLSVGFWSVWMTVFRTALAATGLTADQIAAKLKNLFVDPFPGTCYPTPTERAAAPGPDFLPPAYLGAYAAEGREGRTPYDFAMVP